MRSQIVRVTLVAVSVALLLLAVPLALAVHRVMFAEMRSELERAALRAAGRVGPDFLAGDRVELSALPPPSTRVGVYDRSMGLRAGEGPATADPITAAAGGGQLADGVTDGNVVVAVPVFASERVVGMVRAAAPTGQVWRRVAVSWLGLLGLAVVALGGAAVVARRQARALSRPLEMLSDAASRVTDGDLGVRVGRTAIAEIDRVGQAQNDMVARLAARLQQERHFSANVSHQLRTPLTSLQLGLQAALEQTGSEPVNASRPALAEAVRQVKVLHRTVEDILDLARNVPDFGADQPLASVPRLVREVEGRWHGATAADGRKLRVHWPADVGDLVLPASVVTQVLDVLVENALRHGRGEITVSVRELAGSAMIDVADEGSITTDPGAMFRRGVSAGSGFGIGLAFARTLAEAAGGRLLLGAVKPTRFTLLLPTSTPAISGE